MYTIVGIRDSDGECVVMQVAANECPFMAAMGIVRGYIIRDNAVLAIIDDEGNIAEW